MNKKQSPVSLNIFDLIDSICREFRAQWKHRTRPRLEDWFNRVPLKAQPQLFHNLLEAEIKYRRRKQESPDSGEYLKRFPRFSKQIRQVFDESTMMTMDAMHSTPVGSADELETRSFEIPAANRLGDYELLGELGRGGMGVVYEARHLMSRNVVALKTLPTGVDGQELNADRLHKFRHEFRSLSEINHPNLVGMQTLEVDGDQWFFTMDLVRGEDFLSYVRPQGELDESRLRSALKQLAAGIHALHELRIIHRDLKPSNVLVELDGRVLILDFGLVAQLPTVTDLTVSKSGMFAGTPRYAAPEQMFGERSEASDWYAFGTMLYEALTGRPPFTGKPMELLRKKQSEDPTSLAGNEEFASDLAQLTDGLLKRDPKQRPTTSEIIGALKLDLETRTHGSTSGSQGSSGSMDTETPDQFTLTDDDVILIGREEQLAQLEQAQKELHEKRAPVVVWIAGKSGEGKSSLAEKFLLPIRQRAEMLVLSGRCYDRESVPFKAIDSIIDSLVRYLRSRAGRRYQTELPEDIGFLARLFPLLNRVETIAKIAIPGATRMEPEKIRARGFFAFRELLVSISRRMPVVIQIDDLQWGDSDSAKALVELMTSIEKPALMFLGCFRSDEANESPFLQTWNGLASQHSIHQNERQVQVEPLNRRQCIELAALRTGTDSEVLAKQAGALYEDSGGNPYFVEQLVAGFDPVTGKFQHVPLEEILARRLEKLPETASKLLDVISVSGQPISADEASKTAGLTSGEMGTFTHMRNERLVRLIGDQNDVLVETYHDKIRETVLATMPAEQRRGLHRQLAETIEEHERLTADELLKSLSQSSTPGKYETTVSPRVVDLAHHFAEARDPRSFVYQVIAGEQAVQAYAFEDAVGFYDQAETLMPAGASPALQFRLSFAMGRVSLWAKDFDRAIGMYQKAVEVATNRVDRAEAYAGLSSVYRLVARYDQSITCFNQALAQLDMRRPKTMIGKMFSFATSSIRVLAIPATWQQAKTAQAQTIASLKYAIFDPMLNPVGEKDFFSLFTDRSQAAIAAFQSGEARMIGLGHAVAARLWSGIGISWIGNLCFRRSSRISTEASDFDYRGKYLFSLAEANYWGGDLPHAKKTYEDAIPLLRRCGNFYELLLALHFLRHIHAYLSRAGSELSAARDVLELALEIGHVQGICWGNYDVASALARRGDLSEAQDFIKRSNDELTNERYSMTEAIRASTSGYVQLQCSDYEAARNLASTAWQIIATNFVFCDQTMFCLPILIESIAGADWTSPLPQKDANYLKKICRRAVFLYSTIPNHQPHLQRVSGRAAMALGKKGKAIRKFEKAIELAEKKGMAYQRARSLLDLAAVKEERRESNRREAIDLLKKMESVIPRAESWLLGDQYDESVVAPEFNLEAQEQ